MTMSDIERNWQVLSEGIEVSRYSVIVPWGITKAGLFQLIPATEFAISEGGGWPMLRFRFLGYSALWGFNFVSSPDGVLTELQFRNERLDSFRRTYRRSVPLLQRALGTPNVIDFGRIGQQMWWRDSIRIDNHLGCMRRKGEDLARVSVHDLSILHRSDRSCDRRFGDAPTDDPLNPHAPVFRPLKNPA